MCPPSTAVTNHPDLKKSKLTSATRYPSLMFPVFKKLPLCIHESNAPHLKSKIRLAGVGIYRWTTSQCNSPNGFSHTYNLHTLKHPVGTLKPKHPFWNQRTSLKSRYVSWEDHWQLLTQERGIKGKFLFYSWLLHNWLAHTIMIFSFLLQIIT